MTEADVKIRQEWQEALIAEFRAPYFLQLTQFIKQRSKENVCIYPPGKLIFAAYDLLAPKDVKIVILGQDPYHNPHEAMGLSFSVPKGIKIPASLKNIYKELNNDLGLPIPEHGDLTSWSRQGVMLLNAFLTVEKNQPGSHKGIGWERFTDATISYLSDNGDHLVFMLWGNFAKNKRSLIDGSKHLILEAAHPSPLAGNAFQGCRHFSKANAYLSANAKNPIDWKI
jgi:uracil-DNA glycosylase